MNLVKQSLFLCIGVLLALVGWQGMQSLWQVSRLSGATDEIVASSKLAADAGDLWTLFLDAEGQFKQAIAFMDVAGADDLHGAFDQKGAGLRAGVMRLNSVTDGQLKLDAAAVSGRVEKWLELAGRHVSRDGVTELPSYHLLDAERADLEARIKTLVGHSAELAAIRVNESHARANSAYRWTAAELALAVALGCSLGWLALRSLHRQLGADASEVARIASAVADGDLTVPIRTQGIPEGSVMAATARMQNALVETVARVRHISTVLASGAGEIASGNTDLSRRTEQQAAALEKTAAAMEELGITVSHNADSAGRASELAEQASALASRGGEVVGHAVETMRGINDGSKRIVDIVGVIDAITFQTNILALNAAVEAARAGEHGRGFAVVASEVRSLAQRSANAAKEIKTLITDSVGRVEHGTALVDRAGATMLEVVSAIQRVSAVMAEIGVASAQQSVGVAQVGEAMTEMDRTTQQNAGMAEQSATAAANLRNQAQELVQAVSFFRMQASDPPAPAAHIG